MERGKVKKKMKPLQVLITFIVLIVVVISLFMGGARLISTDNQMAKNYGGTANIEVEEGQKVLNVTWKENNLWVFTREMNSKDTVDVYKFSEKSSYGIQEGTYIITEHLK